MHKKFDKSSNSNRKFPNKEDILKLEPSVEQIEEVKELIEQVDLEHYFANSNIIFKDELIDSNKNEDKKQDEIFQLLMFINKMAEEAVKRLSSLPIL
ncbi:MAG: hypothetical protein ABRQ37_17145 [Candidatus Eremiobacterota bacterium]